MKKKWTILLASAVLAASLLTGCGNSNRNSDEAGPEGSQDTSGMVHLEGADEVSAFIDEVYQGVGEDLLPYEVTTTELDLNDKDMIAYHTGLEDLSGIEGIYLSESMMTSTAYSAVYIRTNDEADAEAVRKQLMDKINPAKWICVTAEKQIAVTVGKDVFLVMGFPETADAVYTNVKKAAESRNMIVSDAIEKTNSI